MKTEAEKIRDYVIIACYACELGTFDPHQLTCVCSIKGKTDPMECCKQFKGRHSE